VRYIPEWFPFTGFKQKAKLYRDTANRARDIPYDFVKKKWVFYYFSLSPFLALMLLYSDRWYGQTITHRGYIRSQAWSNA
jgi:hypothetical protein